MTIPIQTVSPNLPLPTVQYSQDYFNTLTKVLRLYFKTNDNANAILVNQVSTNQTLIWLNPNL